jgi:dTDP-4-amino-4,6-dideoxygalactose transaminase
MQNSLLPFNRPYLTGREILYIEDAHNRGQLSGDGFYTQQSAEWLQQNCKINTVLLTHSCTAALEMIAIVLDIKPGDEVILPSFTFVSTANAFVLRGGIPVFVDIRTDTLNIDENRIESAITNQTKAIVVVHYAGVACEMDKIMKISKKYNLIVVEDAAHAVFSYYGGKPLGSIGDFGTYSFHETKNIVSGEGGALLLNRPHYVSAAEIIRDKGTNRKNFLRGEVDRYTWKDIGSSYSPGELIAAFLFAQLQDALEITNKRKKIFETYEEQLQDLENNGDVKLPKIPVNCTHNGHMFYLVLNDFSERERFIAWMKDLNIACVSHYVPLHLSPAGKKYGRSSMDLPVTEATARSIVRLPLWIGMESSQNRVISAARRFFGYSN